MFVHTGYGPCFLSLAEIRAVFETHSPDQGFRSGFRGSEREHKRSSLAD
jgi:hypothetical protein